MPIHPSQHRFDRIPHRQTPTRTKRWGLRGRGLLNLCLVAVLGAVTTAYATTGPERGQRLTAADNQLVRIGQGTARYAGFIPVYDAILYAQADVPADNILEPAVAKRLEIVYRVSLEADKMIMAAERTLARQHSEDQLARWRSEITTLHRSYRDVRSGDRYALVFDPSDGLRLEFNGQKLASVNSAEFAQLYFGIWLGNSPLSDRLRSALLYEQRENN